MSQPSWIYKRDYHGLRFPTFSNFSINKLKVDTPTSYTNGLLMPSARQLAQIILAEEGDDLPKSVKNMVRDNSLGPELKEFIKMVADRLGWGSKGWYIDEDTDDSEDETPSSTNHRPPRILILAATKQQLQEAGLNNIQIQQLWSFLQVFRTGDFTLQYWHQLGAGDTVVEKLKKKFKLY